MVNFFTRDTICRINANVAYLSVCNLHEVQAYEFSKYNFVTIIVNSALDK